MDRGPARRRCATAPDYRRRRSDLGPDDRVQGTEGEEVATLLHTIAVEKANDDADVHRVLGSNQSALIPAWSPDGTRIAFASSRRPDHDLEWQLDVFVVDVATCRVTRVTDGAGGHHGVKGPLTFRQ